MAEAARKIRYSSYGNATYEPGFDGNAVRAPRGGEVVRPRVLPRERAVARPKVQVREAGQISLFAVAGFLTVGILAAMVLLSYAQLHVLSDQVVSLREEYTTLKSDEARLLAKYELAFDLKSIESNVTVNGRMVKPQESQIFYMDLSDSDSVVLFREDSTTATLGQSVQGLWDKVTAYFR